MITRITMKNVLSFGSPATVLELGKLNVLIGPNGSGKSNVLEVLGLLGRLPSPNPDSPLPIIDWIWKGASPQSSAGIEVTLRGIPNSKAQEIRHFLSFREAALRFSISDERLENAQITSSNKNQTFFFFKYHGRDALFGTSDASKRPERGIQREALDPERSVLAQRNDPEFYPEIAHVRSQYERIRVYRDISFGPNSPIRRPQRTDLPTRQLVEDGSNLALVLNRLKADLKARKRIEELLKRFYETATGVDVRIEGNTAQIYVAETDWITPATRLSDGTMRWLTLLAILLDNDPPVMVCLDEPDLGLHPDCVTILSDLLIEASERMQLCITTHSDVLVDALSDRPECVVICEKEAGQTALHRLEKAKLDVWLEKFSLGQLYGSGQLGGRRW